MTPTPNRTDEIRKRLEAATKGPWQIDRDARDPDGYASIRSQTYERSLVAVQLTDADAEFIAHAPTDLAHLLSENERLRERMARLDEEHDKVLMERTRLKAKLSSADAVVEAARKYHGHHVHTAQRNHGLKCDCHFADVNEAFRAYDTHRGGSSP